MERKQRVIGNRAGAQALRLLASPFTVYVLESLAKGTMSLSDLRGATGFPPQTTMRGHMRLLSKTGILAKRREAEFPGYLDIELATPGRDLLVVSQSVKQWLATAPGGPIDAGSLAAKGALKALVEAWASNMMRAFAARPLSLTELDSLIGNLSYPALERRLSAMRIVGLVEKETDRQGSAPYAVTKWLRQGVAPIVAAVQWERRHIPEKTVPVGPHDVEAAFLLTMPLQTVSAGHSGTCRMGVELQRAQKRSLAGVQIRLENGRLTHCTSRLEGRSDASAVGTVEAWLSAVGDGDQSWLEFGGDRNLARGLVEGLHRSLLGEVRVQPEHLNMSLGSTARASTLR
jgi:DNA-binding HxlR family transcriptional regulator